MEPNVRRTSKAPSQWSMIISETCPVCPVCPSCPVCPISSNENVTLRSKLPPFLEITSPPPSHQSICCTFSIHIERSKFLAGLRFVTTGYAFMAHLCIQFPSKGVPQQLTIYFSVDCGRICTGIFFNVEKISFYSCCVILCFNGIVRICDYWQ